MDLEQARANMIEQQIRTWNVLDQRVLDLIARTPREEFVPEAYRTLAFTDTNIPLPEGQIMMTPKLEARLLQALMARPTDQALEVGTGSGYLSALLARSCRRVVSVELFESLSRSAAAKLARHGIGNVSLAVGDAAHGWEKEAPYDLIALTGSLPMLDAVFQEQLKVGGRLFVIIGEAPIMEAVLITRTDEKEWVTESFFETSVPPLIGAKERQRFVL